MSEQLRISQNPEDAQQALQQAAQDEIGHPFMSENAVLVAESEQQVGEQPVNTQENAAVSVVESEKSTARRLIERGKQAGKSLIERFKRKPTEADSEAASDIADVMVGELVEQNGDQQPNAQIDQALEDFRQEGQEESDANKISEEIEKENEACRKAAMKIKQRIMQSEEAQAEFANGGEEDYLAYIQKQFKENKKLQKLAERIGYYEHAGVTSDEQITGQIGQGAGESVGNRELEPGDVPIAAIGPAETNDRFDGLTSPELQSLEERLAAARDEYVKITTQRRKISIVGYKDKLDQARSDYENIRNAAGAEAARLIKEAGFSDNEVMIFATTSAITEARTLEDKLWQTRVEQAENKRLSKFYDWWAQQGGKDGARFGKLKKMGVMVGIGFAAGATAGVAGAVLAGPVAGGALAATAATKIARGLAGAKIAKEAEASTVARAQSDAQLDQHENEIREASRNAQSASELDSSVVTSGIETATGKEVLRNRKRLGVAAVSGLVSGAAGAVVGDAIADYIDSDVDAARLDEIINGDGSEATGSVDPEVPSDAGVGDIQDAFDETIEKEATETFTIEPGNGFTQEIQDAFPGHTPEEYLAAHQAAIARFGDNYLTGVDKYVMPNGNLGLAQPGTGAWSSPEVEEFLRSQLS